MSNKVRFFVKWSQEPIAQSCKNKARIEMKSPELWRCQGHGTSSKENFSCGVSQPMRKAIYATGSRAGGVELLNPSGALFHQHLRFLTWTFNICYFPPQFPSCFGFDLSTICPQFLHCGMGMFPLYHSILGICKWGSQLKDCPSLRRDSTVTLLNSVRTV